MKVTYVTPALQKGYTYNSGQAENCVNQVSSAYSDAQITSAEYQAIAEACDLVFSGAGVKGSSCAVNSDCNQSEGLSCVIHPAASAPDAGAGSCQVPVNVSAGNSCSAPGAQCAEGYYCGTAQLYCVVDGQAGATCSSSAPCAADFKCSVVNANQQCTAKLLDGTACTADSDCANGMCLTGTNGNVCGSIEIFALNEPFCLSLH